MTVVKKGVALVCSGGGTRGFAHLGFLERLSEAGISRDNFALACGTSIGALVLLLYCAGWPLDEAIARTRREVTVASWMCWTRLGQLWLLRRLLRGRLEKKLRHYFGGTRLEDLSPPLQVVSFDLLRGRPYVHTQGEAVPAVLASLSLPLLAKPIPHNGMYLIDGGIAANLPARAALDRAEGLRLIGVDVAGEYGVDRLSCRGITPWRLLLWIWESRQAPIEQEQRRLCDVVVRPAVSSTNIGDLSRSTFDALIASGRTAAESALPAIRSVLADHPRMRCDR